MTIIAIVSAAILGTAAAAMENARRSRTRSTISKIHGLVMERWDSYANRRIDVSPHLKRVIDRYANAPGLSIPDRRYRSTARGAMMADARLLATRELMKLEMPERWIDVANGPLPPMGLAPQRPMFLAGTPGLTQMYFRRLRSALDSSDVDVLTDNEFSECLYMIVMYGTGDGEARTMFTSQDIGDVDGDGAPEFVDGWGHPILFFRWPAGFVEQSPLMTGDGGSDHDPFDTFNRDRAATPTQPLLPPIMEYSMLSGFAETPLESQAVTAFIEAVGQIRARNEEATTMTASARGPFLQAFRLIPLIFSGGADEQAALRYDPRVSLDPFALTTDGYQNGSPDTESNDWRDNIHNHVNEY